MYGSERAWVQNAATQYVAKGCAAVDAKHLQRWTLKCNFGVLSHGYKAALPAIVVWQLFRIFLHKTYRYCISDSQISCTLLHAFGQ